MFWKQAPTVAIKELPLSLVHRGFYRPADREPGKESGKIARHVKEKDVSIITRRPGARKRLRLHFCGLLRGLCQF